MDLINNCTEGADRSILARGHPTSDSYLKRQGAPYYKKIYYSSMYFKNYMRNNNILYYPFSPELPGYTGTEQHRLSADIRHQGLFKNIGPNLVPKVQLC